MTVLVIHLKCKLLSASSLKHHRGPTAPKAKTTNLELGFQDPRRPAPAPAPPAPPTPTRVWKLRLRETTRLPRATCLEMAELDSNPGPSGRGQSRGSTGPIGRPEMPPPGSSCPAHLTTTRALSQMEEMLLPQVCFTVTGCPAQGAQ